MNDDLDKTHADVCLYAVGDLANPRVKRERFATSAFMCFPFSLYERCH